MIHYFGIENEVVNIHPKLNPREFFSNEKYYKTLLFMTGENEPVYGIKVDNLNFLNVKETQRILNVCKGIINKKTSELIYKGFIHNNVRFKYSDQEQSNWTALMIARDSLLYPYTKRSLDNTNISFDTREDLFNCYMSGLNHTSSYIKSGDDLKDSLDLCDTIPQMKVVLDSDTRV